MKAKVLLLSAAFVLSACEKPASPNSEQPAHDPAQGSNKEVGPERCDENLLDERDLIAVEASETVHDIHTERSRRSGNTPADVRPLDEGQVNQKRANIESWLYTHGQSNCLEVIFKCADEQLTYEECPTEKRKVVLEKLNVRDIKKGLEEINSYLDR